MGNWNQVSHRICSFLDPKQLENYRFGGIFLKFHIFTQITFKTIDFVALFFVGRVGSGRSAVFEFEKNPKIARESIILIPDLKVRF